MSEGQGQGQLVENELRSRKLVSFSVPRKNCLQKVKRSTSQKVKATIDPKIDPHEILSNKELLGQVLESQEDNQELLVQLRAYLEGADDYIEEVLEKLVNGAENASAKMVHNASEIVHNASDLVHRSKDAMVHNASSMVHNASDLVHRSKDAMVQRIRHWKACHFDKLPNWMKDNEHLHFGHRPELRSVAECFKSIFRIHTETGNIWTHLIGFIAFVVVTIVFYVRPLCATCQLDIDLSEKLIFLTFFIGAISCLACSTLFHTLSCHSEWVSHVFSRLDYAGIAFLIVGSIIPWLYYGFYCEFYAKLTYIIGVSVLGVATIVLTLWEKFSLPDFRVYRTSVFVALASLSFIPVVHYVTQKGFHSSLTEASFHCTIIMGSLYLTGALLYAARIPERFMPGKCDIWFQSHQIFHVLVIAAAFVHCQGLAEMAKYRLKNDPHCLKATGDSVEAVTNSVNQGFAGAIY